MFDFGLTYGAGSRYTMRARGRVVTWGTRVHAIVIDGDIVTNKHISRAVCNAGLSVHPTNARTVTCQRCKAS